MHRGERPEVEEKVRDIRRAFGPAIGSRISAYSTAGLRQHDENGYVHHPERPHGAFIPCA